MEKVAEIEPGVAFNYMTFGGQVPKPPIRVRQGDTVNFTLTNGGVMPHNIDFHAVYGPGGGAEATFAAGGQSNDLTFKAMYPGAFIYHCALAGVLDHHISSGMFGLIVVEPPKARRRSIASSTSGSTRSTPTARRMRRGTTLSTSSACGTSDRSTCCSTAGSTPSPPTATAV